MISSLFILVSIKRGFGYVVTSENLTLGIINSHCFTTKAVYCIDLGDAHLFDAY